jgi:two-component system, cell cycle sensor histidine kinase and response regulator CckA
MTTPAAGNRSFSNWSLKTRIALFTLVIFVASFWALAWYVGQLLQRDVQELLIEQQFASVSLVAAQINSDVEERMNSLETIAKSFSPALIADHAALQADLERRMVLKRLFNRGIFVTDSRGTAIASSPLAAGRTGLNFIDKEHVVDALRGKPNVGRPTIGKTLGAPVVVMAVPIRDAQDRVIGAFMGATDLGAPNFLDKVADNRFGKTGGYLLVAPKYRQIITAGDKRRMMETLPAPGKIPLIDRFVGGYEGAGILINPLGVEALAAAKSIPAAGWYVAVQLPTSEAFAPLAALKNRLLLAALLLTLVVGWLTWWMVRRQLQPMLTAIETLTNLSATETPIRALPVEHRDEVGQLITSFNRLLVTLAERETASKDVQNLLESIASRVPGMVYQFRLRANGTSCFPYSSAGIRDIYRVAPEEVREDASKVFANLHPDDYDAIVASIQQSAEKLALWRHEYRVKFADGTVHWLQGNAMPQREDDGAVIWYGFITDVTERRLAEQSLAASELSLEMAMRGGDLGLWDYNLIADTLTVNDRWLTMLGLDPQAPAPTMAFCQTLIFEEDLPQYEAALESVASGRQSEFELEVRIRHRGGHLLWAQKNGGVVERNAGGAPTRIAGTLKDISIRKRAELDARAEWEFAKQILSAMGQGLCVTNLDARLEYVNPAAAKIFGYAENELVGKGSEDIFVKEDAAKQALRRAEREAGKSSTYDADIVRKDGIIVPVQITGVPRFVDGKFAGSIAVMTDLTERKRSEQLLRAERDFASQVLNAMGQGLSVTNAARELEFVNKAFAEMLGYEINELVGKSANYLVVEQDHQLQEQERAKREKGVSSAYEVQMKRRDGTVLPVEIFGVPRLIDGKYAGAIAVVTDLTERKRAEQVLQESEQRFRMLIELSPEASVVQCDDIVVYANPAALSLYGATSEKDFVGHRVMDFVHPESRAEVIERAEKLAAGGTILPIAKLKNLRVDGTVIEVESQPIATVFNGRPAVRVSIRDVTARNRAEAERASLEAQLRESQKMQAIGTLAGGVAHDFNNILAAILGNIELAREDSVGNARALESIDEIRKAATRARDLVQQILSFSRRQPTERKLIKLDALVEESRRLLRATLPMRLSLDVQCDKEVPEVLADGTQIQQAIINLATNAMQAMATGPGRIDIRLETVNLDENLLAKCPKLYALQKRHPGRAVRLSVRDNGPGIPADIIGRIFEPFFTTKPVNEGTGLGLSVVHGIVDAHEGVIEVTSTVGIGTMFDIYLPVATAGTVFKPSVLPTSTGGNAAIKKAAGLRILYLDDDEAMVFLSTRLLERKGFRVSPFSSQQEALDALRATPGAFDVVVSDYNMPGMSGIDVAIEVRTIRDDLPIIIASGFVDEELQAKAGAVGVKAVIFKQTIADEFVNAVAKAAEAT